MGRRPAIRVVAAMVLMGVVAAVVMPAAAHPAVGVAMHPDVGIGPVRIGESRRDVTAALGPGANRPLSDGLGVCSGGLCRAYRVGGAVVGVDFTVPSGIGVHDVGTRSRVLTVDGWHPASGFEATRRALRGWHVLRCSGRPGGWLMFHAASAHGPYSELLFTRDTFTSGYAVAAAPPNGCAFAKTT